MLQLYLLQPSIDGHIHTAQIISKGLDCQIWQAIFWCFRTGNLEESILRGAEQLLSLLILVYSIKLVFFF